MNREQRRKAERADRKIRIAPKRLKHEGRSMNDIEAFYHAQLEIEKKKRNAERREKLKLASLGKEGQGSGDER